MKKVIHKFFWMWQFDKEEQWLNEMAAKGLALTSVGFGRYEFEDCAPGEYKICMEMLENASGSPGNEKYVRFVEETGAQHVGQFARWAYFRKKTADGDFSLFSDNASRIKYLNRIIQLIAILGGINLYIGIYNLLLYFSWHNVVSLLGFVNLLIAVLATIGLLSILKKRKKLKEEQQIFE